MQIKFFTSLLVPLVTAQSTASPSPPPAICSGVGAALGASGSPGGRAELLVLRKSLSPAGPPPDKPFSFAGF